MLGRFFSRNRRHRKVLSIQPIDSPTVYEWFKVGDVVELMPPGPFELLTPIAEINDPTPLFDWTNSLRADTYDLRVGEDPSCTMGLVVDETGITASQFTVTTAIPEGVYFTCLVAKNLDGETPTDVNLGFLVDTTPPGPFTSISPSGTISDNTPLLDWTESLGADLYDFTLSSDFFCQFNNVLSVTVTSTEFQVTTPLPDGIYFACIFAKDNSGNSTTINPEHFFIVQGPTTPPGPFEYLVHTGEITDNQPLLDWEDSAGAETYDLVLTPGIFCAGTIIINEVGLIASEFQITSPLADGLYSFCVTARNGFGTTSPLSSSRGFLLSTVP